MLKVRSDNKRLMREQERILKSLSDRQNPPSGQRSLERNTQENRDQCQGVHDHVEDRRIPRSHKSQTYNEVESGNVMEEQELKKQKVELQGEFRKIKPPTFDGEVE